MAVSCACCLLSVRGLCDGPIPRPEALYLLQCVIICDLGTSRIRQTWSPLGCSTRKKQIVILVSVL